MAGQDNCPDRCSGKTERQHEGLLGTKSLPDGATQHQSEPCKQHQNAGNNKQQWFLLVLGFHRDLLELRYWLGYFFISNRLQRYACPNLNARGANY